MNINVSAWSINKPVPSILLFIMLTILGVMGFRAMKIQQFPDIDLPTIIVTAALPGAAPAQLETEVAALDLDVARLAQHVAVEEVDALHERAPDREHRLVEQLILDRALPLLRDRGVGLAADVVERGRLGSPQLARPVRPHRLHDRAGLAHQADTSWTVGDTEARDHHLQPRTAPPVRRHHLPGHGQ